MNPAIEQIIDTIADMIPDGRQAMLVGFVNIHTPQAEMLMEYFEQLEGTHAATPAAFEGDIGYLQRRRFEMAHSQ